MATGRIGVSPVLRVRWSDQPTAGTTSLSGLDDNSVALVYDAGYEAVYRNGVLLSRGNDYTATDGTTITLIDATIAGDIIEVFANDLVPLTDAISKGQYNAKGALLSASAAATPGVVAVGANGTVLTADSAEVTGLKWAAPAAGGVSGLTLLNSGGTSLSGSSTSVSGISSKNVVYVYINGVTVSGATSTVRFRLNGSTTQADYIANINGIQSNPTYSSNFNEQGQQGNNPDGFRTFLTSDNTSSTGGGSILILGANTTNNKACLIQGYATGAGGNYQTATNGSGLFTPASTISSITVSCNSTFTAGTMYVYTSA